MAKKKKKKQIVATVGLDGKITKHNKKNNYGRTTGSGDNEKTIVATVGLDGKITKHNNNNNKKAEPITTTKKRSYFNKGLFDDGYDFGDVTKTLVATSVDASKDLRKGVMRIGEGLIDTVAYGAGSVAKAFGNEEFANKTDKFIAKDLIEEQEKRIDKTLGAMSNGLLDSSLGSGAIGTGLLNALLNKGKTEEVSLLGDKSDSIVQSVGQIGGTVGLQAVGVPWYLTTGVTGFGAGTQEALQNDATHGEAGVYGGISAASEIMFEKLGGIKFAGKALDTGLKKALSQKISNKALQTLTKFGIDAGAEGTEEVLTEITQNIGQKLTYEDEKTWSELLTSEEAMDSYLESFIAGAVVGGGFNVGKTINSIKSGRDYDTGLTANEQDVVNREISQRSEEKQKEAAVSARIDAIIEEREKTFGTLGESEKRNIRDSVLKELEDGTLDYSTTAISKKEQREIEKQVEEDLRSGNIGIDSIESVISAEKTNRIKALQQEMETADDTRKAVLEEEIKQLEVARAQELLGRIEKDSYLQESYKQEMLKNKEFSREATDKDSDITKELIESAKTARMNDSKKMHNLFEYTNKIANDTKTKYAFVNNEQLKQLGHHEEGKTINGLVRVSEDGSTKVLINVDSDKALNTIIGHETTHLLEGTNEYKALQNIVKEYATTKGEYDSRYKQVSKLYQGTNANIENEITADLVGDYLFTDEQFINNLSVKEPNVFKRIYEYIKHAYKMATAGSAEARQLEQVKRKFDKAYKQISKTTTQVTEDNSLTEVDSNSTENVKLSVSYTKDNRAVAVIENDILKGVPEDKWIKTVKSEIKKFRPGIPVSGRLIGVTRKTADHFVNSDYTDMVRNNDPEVYADKLNISQNIDDVIYASTDYVNEGLKHERWDNIEQFARGSVLLDIGGKKYEASVIVGYTTFNEMLLYDVQDLTPTTFEIKEKRHSQHWLDESYTSKTTVPLNESVTEKGNKVNRSLTKEQEEYFKDSKVRDENGNLKVMYHGTSAGGHTVFDPYGKAKYGLFGVGSYFTDNKEVAESYTDKGRGNNKQIYETYLNITNPIDMDAAADPTAWSKALPDANFPAEGTNEDFYRAMEEYFEDQEYSRWEASEAALEVMEGMGYDGITHIGGGRFNKQDETRHRVYIAFQPEQIKNVDNTKPTSNPDIRYSLSDSKGRKLSEGQQEYFKDSVIRDDNGNLKVMYHGSLESFTVFDPLLKGGKNGSAEGFGIYLTDDKEVAQPYANNGTMYEGYVNITKPATSYKKTISRNDLIKLIKATCEIEAQELVDDGEYDTVEEAIRDTWISNYVDTYKGSIEKSYKKTADEIINSNLNDKNIIHEVMIGSGARTYATAYKFYDTLKATLGIDGLIARWEGDEKDVEVALAFDSNQFKNVDNLNPTEDLDIRRSLSNQGEDIAPIGNYNVYGRDVLLPVRETAPTEEVTEGILPTRETVEEIAPVRETVNMGNPLTGEDLPYVEQQGTDAFNSITDDMAPVEMEETIYDEDEPAADPVNPLEADGRDIEDVGKRSIKAYMYENPEVKPFFQAEAEYMLNDLKNSVKGQKHFNDQLYYDSSGEQGWYGTKRQTSDEIAYLLDNFKYSYADIEKGLKAIIEDHGAENNAISKRIEFMIDERLREGYEDMMYGDSVPPNEEYINLLREKQITEYSDEAYEAWARTLENVEAPTDPITEGGIDYIQNLSREAGIDTADVTRRYGVESIEEMTREQYMDAVKWLDQEAIAPVRVPEATEDIAPIREDIPISQGVQQEVREDGSIGDVQEDIQTKTRKELRKALLEDDVDFLKNAMNNAKNIPGTLMHNTDTIRVTEMVFGREAGKKINEAIFQKALDNEARSIYWQNKQRADIKALGIKPKSKMSAAVQKYGEKQYINDFGDVVPYGEVELKQEFPNEADQIKIRKAARIIREKYDIYIDKANAVLTQFDFDPIQKRNDYMRHFEALNDLFSQIGVPFNKQEMKAHKLPTDINGKTEFFKPQKNFFANAMERMGMRTSLDAITGIDGYIPGIANLIFHTEDIQRGRAFEELIRDTYGTEGGKDKIKDLPEDEQALMDKLISESHLGKYVSWLGQWINNLAGKKDTLDRAPESKSDRAVFTVLDTIRKQVGANMIGFNIASSLTNLISPIQAISKTNKVAVMKGTVDTLKNIAKNDGFVDKNPFLTARFGTDMLSKTLWQRIQDSGYIFMKGVDHFSSNLIVRSKYNELISKGMSENEAHKEAGKFAARIMGDRTKGAQPSVYNSKLFNIVAQFQLEVNNQVYSMFYDTYHESKEKAKGNAAKMAAGMTFTLGQLFAFTHIFGKGFEHLAGYNPTFDVLGIVATLLGIGGDEEEEKPLGERASEAGMQLLKALPYSNLFVDGGRIPIAQALPIRQVLNGEDKYGNDKPWYETVGETLPYYFAPAGYGQYKKTKAGLKMFDDDLPVAGSYTDSGNMRFPVEDTLPNKAQAAIFGQWANKNAQDYIDNERAPLKEKQIEEYKELDLPIADYWKIREGLKGKKTLEKKFDYIADLDLPVAKKNILINNAVNRKEDIDLEDYSDFGSYEEFDFAMKNPEKYAMAQAVGGYKKYKKYSDTLYNIKANKDKNGESVRNSRKMKVVNYINGLEIPDVEKYILFKSEYNSDDTYNREILDYLYGRSDITHEQREAILTQLGFEVSGDTVYW